MTPSDELQQNAHAKSKSAKARLRNALILAPVALFPLVLLVVLFFFRSSSRKRAIADSAIYQAQTSRKAEDVLGLPIQPGWPVRGDVISKNGFGNADLAIPLQGSRAKGTLAEWAQQERGKWHICGLDLMVPGQPTITLVDETRTHCERE